MRPPLELWGFARDGVELRPLTGGHRNLAFRTVGLGVGRELVFKSTRRAEPALQWLNGVQEIARRAGFIVPEMRAGRDGRWVQARWCCETFVEGIRLGPEESPALYPQIAAFHASTAGLPQRPGFLSCRELIDQPSGGDVDLRDLPEGLASRCRAAWRAVAGREETIIHGDLNLSNLILCEDGHIALVDWDECRRDLALFDLSSLRPGDEAEQRARLAWEVACSWGIEPDYAQRLAARL